MSEPGDASGGKALGDFLSEAQEIIEHLNRDVLKLDDNRKRGQHEPELINNIFRSAHSLKGLAGMFGARGMSDFAHALESLLDGLRMGRVAIEPEVLDLLFESVELFNQLIVEASGGAKVAKRTVTGLKKQLEKLLESARARAEDNPLELVELEPAMLGVLTEYEEYRLVDNIRRGMDLFRVRASFDLMSFDEHLAKLTSVLKTAGELISTLPSSAPADDQAIDFDLLVGARMEPAELEALVRPFEARVERIPRRDAQGRPTLRDLPAPPATPAPAPGRARPAAPPAAGGAEAEAEGEGEGAEQRAPAPADLAAVSLRSVSQTVRVDIKKLDSLMNIVGEMVLVRTAMQAISEQLKAEQGFSGLAVDLFKAARTFSRRLDELQAGIMEVRMVPLGQNFEKLSRMVRKLSRTAGKEVELRLSGADTELDKLIVEDLADPLMHILRNALDHGLESPAERRAAGKSETGVIRIDAYQKGNHVVIEVADDGRGVDLDRVRAKAMERGLVDGERAAELSERELLNLLFLPGFSTSDQVSELSGRGVGLDVVKTNIANLRGMIDMHSVPGQGTRLLLTLPITLAIIRALLVRTSEEIYAIPLSSVIEILEVAGQRVRTLDRREVLELRGTTLPLLRLQELFELPAAPPSEDGQTKVVVVGLAENRLGIVVDGLIGQQDIVIKALGPSLAQVPGIAGATNLAGQQTILVLDVGSLIQEARLGDMGRQA
ncbi:MAG TPA: chemotaxis protein CheA [Myxococcota bacterium]|nr:chemotaxis protein CheA [Myxococcota bacterium]HRY92694.1 chemotaxis protein CheA [Myxococcota bacterium]HSA22046.1 chemotaxis protein CheA [Myxococcota bacterium]